MTLLATRQYLGMHLVRDHDAVYERDVFRHPTGTKPWLAYITFMSKHGTQLQQSFVMERACLQLPRSYKLWKLYLTFRTKHVARLNASLFASEYHKVNVLFERALVLLNKMPRIWELYLHFLLQQPRITTTRRAFDRALRALPTTQHARIWALYRRFSNLASGLTAVKIWHRYTQFLPEHTEDFAELLQDVGMFTVAAGRFVDMLNSPKFASKRGKSQFDLWSELVDLFVERATDIDTANETGVDIESILRSGITRFADQAGRLWCGLATYWIRRGNFERARDVFEEAMTIVMTVRDFSLVYDAYVEFEESVIGSLMGLASARVEKRVVDESADFDLDIRMLRFEQLMDRRLFLLNDVYLRQNPNSVLEWEKRVALWGDNAHEVARTYGDAIAAIQPKKAIGPFHKIWSGYARFYERSGDLRHARVIMDKAVKVPYKSVAELADMWIEWAQMELRNDNFDEATRIMAKAVQSPKRSAVDYFDESLSPQQRVHKSWKLWSFYVDLVESVGTLEEARKIYERIFELRIATPQTVVNLANLLEEHRYYEESFKIYERGLDLFSYPVAFELWNIYLTKAVDRKISIERLRDLFEQAVEDCPPKFAKVLYLMYGNLEEERGLARHAMRIYERATRAVAEEDRADMFNFYITKSASNFGLPSTRPIYERAIAALPDSDAKNMCMKFAEMEKRLGEIDRARAIYGHAAQFCDPRTNPDFWAKWEMFEVQHGNEDTYKEMLRIKRSVQAQYNTDVNFIASQALARSQQLHDPQTSQQQTSQAPRGDTGGRLSSAMDALDRQVLAPTGFVVASEATDSQPVSLEQPTVAANPDSIQVDEGLD